MKLNTKKTEGDSKIIKEIRRRQRRIKLMEVRLDWIKKTFNL